MSFTDRKQFEVSAPTLAAFQLRKSKAFCCALCGHVFALFDKARWIYCNSTPGQGTGNFFVCDKCDGTDEECRTKGKASHEAAIKSAKAWGIYGPDWERQ